ncbi:MAG: OmpA family protein, partial [Vicinamibacterales bacterium]
MTGLRLPLPLALVAVVSLVPLVGPTTARADDEVSPSIRMAAACAPVGTAAPSRSPRVFALVEPDPTMVRKTQFVAGDRVGIDKGAEDGMKVGDRYVVRRPFRFVGAPDAQHTIGWLHIADVHESTSTAEIDFACDAIAVDDRLAPAEDVSLPPGVARTFVGGTLEPRQTLVVSYGMDARATLGDRDFVLAERRRGDEVAVGDRYTAFHRSAMRRGAMVDGGAEAIGEAIVVAVFPRQSLLRMTAIRDAVLAGDSFVRRIGATDPMAGEASRPAVATPIADAPLRVADESAPGRGGAADRPGARPADHTVLFDDIYFGLDRFTLRPEARAKLDEAVTKLQADPSLRVRVEGHT